LPHEDLARAIKRQWLRLRRDQARDLAPGAGALPGTGAAVEGLVQTVAGDRRQVYDPTPRVSRTCDPASWTVSRASGRERLPWSRGHNEPCSRPIQLDGS
jgi:hypothetical protein